MSDQRIDQLYRAHREAILGYLLRRVAAPEDAADLLTEVFVVALRRRDDVPAGDEGRLWLYGVARRLLANHRRGVRRYDDAVGRLRHALATAASAQPAPAEDTVVLRQQLGLLSDDDREMLTLTAWDDLTPAEAANVLGLKPTTARARLFRARRRLKARLGAVDSPGDEDPSRRPQPGLAAVGEPLPSGQAI